MWGGPYAARPPRVNNRGMRYLRYGDIRVQEEEVSSHTRELLPGFFKLFEEGINLLLGLQQTYPTSRSAPVTPTERFRSGAVLWFFSSIFSFSSSVALAERGYYTESTILNRSITELLVQIRYFSLFPQEMEKLPALSANNKRQIQIKTMCEKVAPGFYDMWYKFSSEFAHAGMGAHIFKITRDVLTGVAHGDPGIVFKEDWCSCCFNEVLMLLLGFIRAFAVAFPDARTVISQSVSAESGRVEKLLDDFMDDHMKLKGGPNEWHNLSRPLWKP